MNSKIFLPAVVVVCILLPLAWYQFVYEPTQREILNMQLETRRLRQVEREIIDLKARHENLSAFIAAKDRQLDDARKFLPTTPAQDKFIDELYRTAEIWRVRLAAVQTGEIISANDLQTQSVTVGAEAEFVALLNFIREILDGGRAVSLEKFFIERAGGNVLSCKLTFKIFSAPIKDD